MTFEERMEALTRRHEALAQTVELIGHQMEEHQRAFAQIALRFQDTGEFIDRLARIAGVHQDRIDEHEQRLDNLEH